VSKIAFHDNSGIVNVEVGVWLFLYLVYLWVLAQPAYNPILLQTTKSKVDCSLLVVVAL